MPLSGLLRAFDADAKGGDRWGLEGGKITSETATLGDFITALARDAGAVHVHKPWTLRRVTGDPSGAPACRRRPPPFAPTKPNPTPNI